jgi:dienelactone hydrolase
LLLWLQKVSKDVHAAIEVLKAKGVTKFGSAGWCWGAAMAVQAAAEPTFSATAFLHPSVSVWLGQLLRYAAVRTLQG